MNNTTTPQERSADMERKLRARSWFWHLVKEVRELQTKLYVEHRTTYGERDRLKTLLKTLDEYLAKMIPRLLTLGLIEEEDETWLHDAFGDEYKNVPRPAYKARHGYQSAKPIVFSIWVLEMRQNQRYYLATRKTFLYPIIFSSQKVVDEYLEEGELYDQLQLMPMRRNETQPTQQS